MATLADELQNDFADSGSEAEEQDNSEAGADESPASGEHEGGVGIDEDEGGIDQDVDMENGVMAEADEEHEARVKAQRRDAGGLRDLRSVTTFMKTVEPVLERIAYYHSLPHEEQTRNEGLVEDNPQYQLLAKSNTLSTSIDDHVADVHKYIRDHYSTRFPELETLLPDPLEYTKAVTVIGNGPMDNLRDIFASSDNQLTQPLNAILNRPKLMTITVEATTTRGEALSDNELQLVQDACKIMLRLEQAKKVLTEYVQSRMNLFAPNLTNLIGSLTAAQLLNARGGLTALANTRASNIAAIGSKRAAHSGFATNVGVRNQGYLYDSDLISRFRPELRTQAMRIVSAKVVLAARVDRVHESPDGTTGDELREQCEKRLDKLIEPPPNKGQRALPAPDDKPSKKRGGRRARKAKEATAMTDMRKAQNRMAFGKEEQEVGYGTGDSTVGLGMIGQSNDNKIRALQVDQRTKAKLSKKNPGWGSATPAGGAASSLRGVGQGAGAGNASVLKGHGLRTSGVATSLGAGGTASSLNFTPKQGLELVDPKIRAELERKAKADEDRWFRGGTFTQVGGGSSVVGNGTTKPGEFKKPELPLKRKLDAANSS